MKRKRLGLGVFVSIFGVAQILWAGFDTDSGAHYRLVGRGSFESGQVVKGEAYGGDIALSKVWCQRIYSQLGFEADIDSRTHLSCVGESMVRYAWAQTKDALDNNKTQYLFYPYHVEGSYSFGNSDKPFLTAGFGVFPFKYNPDVRNLGEYLFRTGSYPPTMSNQFDFPLARLTGFKLSSNPIDSLHINALLTVESEVIPLKDFSVSLLADYTVAQCLTVGGGVVFSRLLSVNEELTTPKKSNNLAPIDSINPDTTYYSFRGTKLMGRLSFDPKVFLPWKIFGENDLRLYSEVAVLGLQNYPLYYKELYKRIPLLIGFNIPSCKVLDVLSVEVEYYRWNYPNSYTYQVYNSQLPLPDVDANYDSDQNNLKWSFFAKKSLNKNFSIVGQVAYDHTRLESNAFVQGMAYFGDAMHKHGDWSWMLKCAFAY